MARNPLIVALDTADLDRLTELAATLGPHVGALKIGLQAYAAHGPAAVHAAAAHAPIFLDLKLHDIPATAAGAAAAIADLGVAMTTVHASGGPAMVAAAVKAAPDVCVLAVTVLTSLDDTALAVVGQPGVTAQVHRLAAAALDAGAGGVVCAPTDVADLRALVGDDVPLVVPGIRPVGAAHNDQSRVATPAQALAAGATWMVVGRPITTAPDPAAAVEALLAQIAVRTNPYPTSG